MATSQRPMSTRNGFEEAFQAVILAGGQGKKLAPLTDGANKATLPVANKPLISYQLDYLEAAGITEVIIVVNQAAAAAPMRMVADARTTMRVSVEVTEDGVMGTADALRQIRAKLRTDFCVMPCDLQTNAQLGAVLDAHRVHQGAVTALVVQQEKDEKKKVKTEDFIIVDEMTDALLMIAEKSQLKEALEIRRTLFDKYPRVAVRSDLADPHFYVFAHWVLDVLEKKSDFVSIKRDLLPFLLRKQYSMTTADIDSFPPEASEEANPRIQHLALGMSSSERSWVPGPDGAGLLHCHAFVVDAAKPTERCQRVNTLGAYADVNRMLAKAYRPDSAAQAALESLPARLIGSECVVGPGLTATGEGSSVKRSVVGANCTIGAGVKIVDCVLMDNVTIEDGCSLNGVTVCSGAHVEQACELRQGSCVGHDYRVPAQTQAAKDTHFSAKTEVGGVAAGGGED